MTGGDGIQKLGVLVFGLSFCVAVYGLAWNSGTITPAKKVQLRDKVLEMFTHAYSSYMKHAYPADELMPIACKGRYRGVTTSRGDVDDALGNFSLTLIDTLDTLAVLGMYDEFEDAVKKVETDVRFDSNLIVSVFETNIRILGGLLGGHAAALEIQLEHDRMKWYNGSLLRMAKEVGDRLLPAFNTTTGIPMSRVNLKTGAVNRIHDKDTCTACAGTMILEMAALSRFTGDPIYEDKARKAMDYLWSRRQRSSDLMGTVLNVHDGEWIRKESGIGAGIDSYYEYLLKAYIVFSDEEYLLRFNAHHSAIKQYVKQGPLLINVMMHQPDSPSRNFMDALGAFWPGLLVLKGDLLPAIENHELLYQVFQRHKFLPEAFTTSFDIFWGQYPLRPEFAESTYLLYQATKDPYYLEVGRTIIENLENHTRVECGYAGIKDVRTFNHEDRMDSYFLAEMFKYLYLLFSPATSTECGTTGPGLKMENYLLTTEAHLLPLYLSTMPPHGNKTSNFVAGSDRLMERQCENSEYVRSTNLKHLQKVRGTVRKFFHKLQPDSASQASCKIKVGQDAVTQQLRFDGPRMLVAKDFDMMDKDHINLIKLMGITTEVIEKGKIQLNFDTKLATSERSAAEGRIFLYEIQELNKATEDQSVEPVLIQLLSQPYLGAIILKGGPAQFGPSMSELPPTVGALEFAYPFNACSKLQDSENLRGKIVLAGRGDCMFVTKVLNIELAGGVAALIIDNNSESAFAEGPAFTMAGDGSTETSIPSAFLFSKEAKIIQACLEEFGLEQESLVISMGYQQKSLDEVIRDYGSETSGSGQNGKENEIPPPENSSTLEPDGESKSSSDKTKESDGLKHKDEL